MMVLSLPRPAARQSRGTTKLLVVDDIESNLIAMKALLARPGVELLEARSGSEALKLLLSQDIALALIDVHMPLMDGFELAELMRSSPRTRDIPILFITASDSAPVRRGYRAGAADFLFKPLDVHALHNKVDAFLQLQQRKEELEAQAELLQHTLKLNETFTAVLGHDLRNPLGAILAISEMIAETTTDDSSRQLASRISSSALRMRRMIEQLIDMARARSGGRIPLCLACADLGDLCERAIQEIEARADGRTVDVMSTGDATGRWDVDRLMQVLSNLIGNAVHHGERAHPVSVHIDATERHEVRLSVHNGGAIRAETLPHIFEPWKSHQQYRRGDGGMGLGLYIARMMVEAHGGTIDVRSDLARGTTVEVHLPREARPPAPNDDTLDATGGRQA